MGFTTGFIGGITLTYSLLYLTIHIHRQNRLYQSTLLTQQSTLLSSLYTTPDQSPYTTDHPAYELRPAGLTEQLKDRWNRDVANAVRHLQEKDWEETRVRWERRAGNIWARVAGSDAAGDLKRSVEQVGESVKEGAEQIRENVKEGAEQIRENAKKGAEQIRESVKEGAEQLRESVKEGAEKVRENVKDAVGRGEDELKRKARELKRDAKEVTGQKRLLEL